MSKPVIPEGRTGTPNIAGLRRSRLTKAPDQDFVVQVATRDENALRLVPNPPAGPAEDLHKAPAPQQAQVLAQEPQQTPVQAQTPQQAPVPAQAPQQAPVQGQAPAQAFQQPAAAPQPAPAAQQPVQPQTPASAAAEAQAPQPAAPVSAPVPPPKPQADEPPRKKKENYLQDWDDAARVRRAFNRTKHITGIENWSEFVSAALLEKAAQLEAQYNEGQPFDGSTKAPMGRPAAAE